MINTVEADNLNQHVDLCLQIIYAKTKKNLIIFLILCISVRPIIALSIFITNVLKIVIFSDLGMLNKEIVIKSASYNEILVMVTIGSVIMCFDIIVIIRFIQEMYIYIKHSINVFKLKWTLTKKCYEIDRINPLIPSVNFILFH